MHHCLHVAEIVDLIVEFSQPFNPGSRQTSTATLALALTCKAFYDPALNVYWNTLESFRPLMALFPEDVCAADEKGTYVSPTLERASIAISLVFSTFNAARRRATGRVSAITRPECAFSTAPTTT